MIKHFLLSISFLFVLHTVIAQQDTLQNIPPTANDTSVYTEVPIMPTFLGSKNSNETSQKVFDYFKNKVKDSKTNYKGIVYLSFVVNQDGKTSSIQIRKGAHEELNQLATKFVSEMTDWTPGELLGKKVRVQYTVPVRFVK